jgi:hypothetical protein
VVVYIATHLDSDFEGWIIMHLSLERIFSTVALLSLALVIVPQLFGAPPAPDQQSLGSMGQLLDNLLSIWAIDLIVISLSVDEVSLTLSIIPFLCIFPTALMICLVDSREFARIVVLAVLTIVFVIARYLANSV